MEKIYKIIKRPMVTEKGTFLGEKQNSYLFEVDKNATKPEIKSSVEKLFNVKVKDINTMIVHGKIKRVGKYHGKRANWKKAIVTLHEGQKIQVVEGV